MAAPPNYFPTFFSPVWDDEMQRKYDEWGSAGLGAPVVPPPAAGVGAAVAPVAATTPMDPNADPSLDAAILPTFTTTKPHVPYPDVNWDGNGPDPNKAPVPVTAYDPNESEGIPPTAATARIAQATAPIGTVGQIGQGVDPTAAQPGAVGRELPSFTPDELAAMGQAPTIDMPEQYVGRGPTIDMPDEYVGRTPQTIDMPDDFAGRELGPQDPYQDYTPDAVSGGATPAQTYDEQQAAAAGGPVAGQTTGEPQMPDDYLSDAELGQKWADLPVEEQIAKRAELEQAKQNFQSSRILEESKRQQEQAAADLRTYQQSQQIAAARSKEIEHDAEILAMKHNPLDDIGIGQKVAAAGAAIIGGFLGNQGGVETIDKLINQAVAQHAQQVQLGQQNLAARRTSLGEQNARDDDMYKTMQTYRVGAWNQFINGLESEVQQYDPRGSTAMRVMDQINQAKAQRAKAIADGAEEDRKRVETSIKLGQEQQKIDEARRHNMAEEAAKAAKVGAGSAATAAYENPLVKGLSPKDRERAVISPDGKTLRLALDHETAIAQRDEIASGKAAIGAMDSLIADLSNDTGIMTKLKAKIGLNPQELAVIKSKLSLAKPQIAKVAAGSKRIPLAELHAVDAATDDPSNFTSETLAQIRALRDATVNDLADKFGPEYPNFITKDSFGHAPTIAEPPNANTLGGALAPPVVRGDRGIGRFDVTNFGQGLDRLFKEYAENPGTDGTGLGGSKGFTDQVDELIAKHRKAADEIRADIDALTKKPKRTAAEAAQLVAARQALGDRETAISIAEEAKKRSVEAAAEEKRLEDEAKSTTKSPAAKVYGGSGRF